MNDEGSIAEAFLADGSLSSKPAGAHAKENAIAITFTETTWWVGGSCGKP
jgi:hypothetical protein